MNRPKPHNAPKTSSGNAEDEASVQALIEEIDSEVKAAEIKKFFEKHGKAVMAGLVAVIVGTAIASTWSGMVQQQKEKDTSALIALLDKDASNMTADQIKANMLDIRKMGQEAGSAGHRMAARFAEAGSLLSDGKHEDAVKVLEAVRADEALSPLYRDYALLMAVQARMGKDDPDRLLSDLAPLLTEGNAWALSAHETAAILESKKGDKDKALEHLKVIMETPDATAPAVERAKILARLYRQ